MMANTMLIDVEDARNLCERIFMGAGLPEKDAKIAVDNLIMAELRGISSHGLSRMAVYSKRLDDGFININPNVKILKESTASLLVDADNGLGQPVGVKVMDMCIEKAKKNGTAICSVRHGNHFGIAAYYAMRALEHDMIGIALTNAPKTMSPWGGINAMIGTNPFCFAIPAGKRQPFVLDCATSVVARGKIILADKEGRDIPEGWGVDKKGRPTTNPKEALTGSVLPFGTYKGSGISILIDILCALLSGADFGVHIGELYDNSESKQNLGFFFSAIDIKSFTDPELFKERMDQMICEIKGGEKAENVEEIFIPGEIEFINEKNTRDRGIEIGQGVLGDLCMLTEKFNVNINPKDLIKSM